jgi:hypothetical protein
MIQESFCFMQSEFMRKLGGKKQAQTLVSHAWEAKFENTVLNIVLDATDWTRHELMEAIKAEDERVKWEREKDLLGKEEASELEKKKPKPMKLDESIFKKNPDALDKVYWLDIFAVNQHITICGEELEGRLPVFPSHYDASKPKGGEIACETDKFHEVVQIVSRVMLSLDPELKTLLRLWVHNEIAEVVRAGKPLSIRMVSGITKEATVKLVRGEFIVPPVKDAKFSVRDDYERTIEKVEQLSGGQVSFTELIRAMVDLRLGRCSVLDKDSSIEKELRTMAELEINASWCAKDMNSTRDLESLLELSMNSNFKKFKGMRHFSVSFNRCVGLKSADELGLALAELPSLLSLRLDLRYCVVLQNIDAVGKALGQMTALTSLHVDIAYCKELTSIEEFGKGLGNCTKITNLYLDLGYLVEEKEQERGRGNPPPTKAPERRAGAE